MLLGVPPLHSIEPYTSNIYTRRVLSGEFQVVNPHLLRDLVKRGLWSEEMKNAIIACNGSVQRIDAIPDDLKGTPTPSHAPLPQSLTISLSLSLCVCLCMAGCTCTALYKTVWEISQKAVIDLAADRGAYIDQSQSLNIHIAEPNHAKLTSMHFYGWKRGACLP